jgi:4'-phosphopantetheinyl transferase
MNADLHWEAIRATLQRGGVAVLLAEAAQDIEVARRTSRRIGAEAERATVAPCGTGPYVSRSATAGLAAAALCQRGRVGIDVERIRPELIDDDLLRLALHPTERAAQQQMNAQEFYALWTRKEAVLKALGVGLALAPSLFVAPGSETGWTRCDAGSHGSAQVRAIQAPPGFCAALAALEGPMELVSTFYWPGEAKAG